MEPNSYEWQVTSALFECRTIDEILDLLVLSNLAIKGSLFSAVVTVNTEGALEIRHSKLLSFVIPRTLSCPQDEIGALARLAGVAFLDPLESSLSSQIADISVAKAKCVAVVPIWFSGCFYGFTVTGLNRGAQEGQALESSVFLLSVVAKAIARFLHKPTMWSSMKSQPLERLTDRQMHICDLIERGLSNSDISSELHLSLGSVKLEVSKILRKLGVANRKEIYVPKDNETKILT